MEHGAFHTGSVLYMAMNPSTSMLVSPEPLKWKVKVGNGGCVGHAVCHDVASFYTPNTDNQAALLSRPRKEPCGNNCLLDRNDSIPQCAEVFIF